FAASVNIRFRRQVQQAAIMVQETFLSAFQIPQAWMPAASAAAPPPMSYAQQLQQMQQQQQTAATLLQLQPYIAMLLAAANKDREQLQTRLEEMPSPPEGDIIKPIPVMPSFGFAAAHQVAAAAPLVTSPTAAATFPTTMMDTSAPPSSPSKGNNTASRNKLGRSYNPGRPLAMEDRRRILDLYEQGHKISHIARQIGVTHSCVSKIMSRFRRTGSMQPRSFAAAQQPHHGATAAPAAGGALGAPLGAPGAASSIATLLALQSAVYPMELARMRDDDSNSDSEHISVTDDGETTSKCDSPMSRLSISPSSAFSPPVRKNSPTYSIESILNQ
ncbi:npax-1, partial [Pristionchus pacificus]